MPVCCIVLPALKQYGGGIWPSITITMLMTTSLLSIYLYYKRMPVFIIAIFLLVYLTIEGSFLVANLYNFIHGGWFTIQLGGFLFLIMYVWFRGRRIKNSFIEFLKIETYADVIKELSRHNEIDVLSRYDSLRKHNVNADFRFVVIDRIQNYDFDFPPREQFIMDLYAIFKRFGISEVRALGLDTSNVVVETVPLYVAKDIPMLVVRNDQAKRM